MKMINIGDKDITLREAMVEGKVSLTSGIIKKIKDGKIEKGNVLEAAKIAGILAAKNTPHVIPLCHPINIEYVNIDFSLFDDHLIINTVVRGMAKTGVEMEALTATSLAALTIYDMCKSYDKGIVIKEIKLIKKTGGKNGTYIRKVDKDAYSRGIDNKR